MPIRPFLIENYPWIEDRRYRSPLDEAVFRCERVVRAKLPDIEMPFEEWAAFIDLCWDRTRQLWSTWKEAVHYDRNLITKQIWIEQYNPPATRTTPPEWAALCVTPDIVIAGVFPLAKSWAIHEIAHAATDQGIFRMTRQHGAEWRRTYLMMLDEMYPEFGKLLKEEFDNATDLIDYPPPVLKAAAGAEVLEPLEIVTKVEILPRTNGSSSAKPQG